MLDKGVANYSEKRKKDGELHYYFQVVLGMLVVKVHAANDYKLVSFHT
jgi:hypothetical protein